MLPVFFPKSGHLKSTSSLIIGTCRWPMMVLFSHSKCDYPTLTKVLPNIIAVVENSGVG